MEIVTYTVVVGFCSAGIPNYQLSIVNYQFEELSGGYCGGVPPLPIPNREVKPACADGTAMQCGRVGGRHFFLKHPVSAMRQGAFFVLGSGCLIDQGTNYFKTFTLGHPIHDQIASADIVLCLMASNKKHLFCLLVSNKSIIFAHVFIFSIQMHHGNNERNIPYPDS